MKHRVILALVALSLAAAGCVSTKPVIRHEWDGSTDISKYATFNFMKAEHGAFGSSLMARRVRNDLGKAMVAKGYQYTTTSTPDFLVQYYLWSRPRTSAYTSTVYYGGPYGGVATQQTNVSQYAEGTFTVDIIDVNKNHLVWRGIAYGEAQGYDEAMEFFQQALAGIFAKIPEKSAFVGGAPGGA